MSRGDHLAIFVLAFELDIVFQVLDPGIAAFLGRIKHILQQHTTTGPGRGRNTALGSTISTLPKTSNGSSSSLLASFFINASLDTF
jgi:hypothetical protein